MDDTTVNVLVRDSFRQWKKAILKFKNGAENIFVYKSETSEKPLLRLTLNRLSLSIINNTIRFSKKKGSPIFIQFEDDIIANGIFKQLSVYSKDFVTSVSLGGFTEAVVMSSEKGIIIALNPAFCELFGYSENELIGQNVSILMEDKIANIHNNLMQNYWKTGVRRLIGKSRLVCGKHKDGTLFAVIIQLGELVDIVNNKPVHRVIATFIPEGAKYQQSEKKTINSETTITVFSEDDWSEDVDEINMCEIIDKLATHIELNSDTEGIFRVSGNFTETQDLWTQIFVTRDNIDFTTVNVHNLCDILKRCIQEKNIIYGDVYKDLLELAEIDVTDVDFIPRVFSVLQLLPEESQLILNRLFLLFSHILTRVSSLMTSNSLAIVCTPLLINPSLENVVEHTKKFTKLFSHLIKHNVTVISSLPSLKSYSLFHGPEKLSDTDWTVLMTNSHILEVSNGDKIIPEDGRDRRIYYLASGSVSIIYDNTEIGTYNSGEYIGYMANINGSRTSAVAIAMEPCKIIKLSVSFIASLFASDRDLFYRFFWDQAKVLATRMKSLPLILSDNNTKKTFNREELTKLEIHLSDGNSRWMDFPMSYTVLQIRNDLKQLYPRYSKKARLIETSHGRDLSNLEDTWTVYELLLRAKYACDYKICYYSDEPLKKGELLATEESIVIKQYNCKRKKKLGILLILQTSIVHVSKLFGLHTKHKIEISSILKISTNNNRLTIQVSGNKPHEFIFKQKDECTEASRLINSLKNTSLLSPRDRKQSLEFEEHEWGVILKKHRVLQPTLIDLRPGDLIQINKSEGGFLYGSVKDIPIQIPSNCVEPLNSMSESPLMLTVEELSSDINYHEVEEYPSKNDWAKILLCGKILKFEPGDIIVPFGSKLQRLYQIVSGYCAIKVLLPEEEAKVLSKQSERWASNFTNLADNVPYSLLTIRTIEKGESFGEIGLCTKDGSMASVVASGDTTTTVFMVEILSLAKLFEESPKLGGRFAKYIHDTMQKRLTFEVANRKSEK